LSRYRKNYKLVSQRAAGAPSAARRRELCEPTGKFWGFWRSGRPTLLEKSWTRSPHRRRTAHAHATRDAAKPRREPLTACWSVLWHRCELPAGAAATADTFPAEAVALPCSSRQRHQPLRSLHPHTLLVSQGSSTWEGVESGVVEFETQRIYLGGRSRRTQRSAADWATAARGPVSGCSVEVLAAILYGETATPAK
jgi:hypothetical protein